MRNFFSGWEETFFHWFIDKLFFSSTHSTTTRMSASCVNFNTFLTSFLSHFLFFFFRSSPPSARRSKVCYLVLDMRRDIVLNRSHVSRRLFPLEIIYEHRRILWNRSSIRSIYLGKCKGIFRPSCWIQTWKRKLSHKICVFIPSHSRKVSCRVTNYQMSWLEGAL